MLVDRELLIRPAPQRTMLGHALNLLAGAAMRFRDCFGSSDPPRSLIGFFAHRRLLTGPAAAPQLKFASRRALPCPAPPVTLQTKPWAAHAEPPSPC